MSKTEHKVIECKYAGLCSLPSTLSVVVGKKKVDFRGVTEPPEETKKPDKSQSPIAIPRWEIVAWHTITENT